jgi:hypothetical protein
LVNDIEAGKNKILVLDKIAFSCEQEYRRKEQQLQELIEKKNIIEKWIVKILKNDDYLKQIVKENVQAVFAENKKLISVSFAALIQTLKADPKMTNLIYKILTANDVSNSKIITITLPNTLNLIRTPYWI